MPCPVHNPGSDGSEDSEDGSRNGLERRSLLKSALVIGGASALSTTVGLFGMSAAAAEDPITVAERQNRQHAWDAFEAYNERHEQSIIPKHQLLLHLEYRRPGKPLAAHRREVEEALEQLERAFEWSHEGLLFTVGYSADYFRDRYDGSLPPGLDPTNGPKPGLMDAKTLIETEGVTLTREEPAADRYDAVVHMASDSVQTLLAAEEALWGNREAVNGVTFDATFEGIFEKPTSYPERRVGFHGHDNVSERLAEDTDFDADRLHDDANLTMGFNDVYENSVPREVSATMIEGQKLVEPKPPEHFAQGTIQHVSSLDVNLSSSVGDRDGGWYDDHDLGERRDRMFSPHHTEENTGEVGENLGHSTAPGETAMRDISKMEDPGTDRDSDPTDDTRGRGRTDTARKLDIAERVEEDASGDGVVGHAQKVARARFDLESRFTDEAIERFRRAGVFPNPALNPETDVPGHDSAQEAEQVILRRDFAGTDRNRPGNHFVALMRFNPYMVYVRRAMNGVDFDTATFGLETGRGEPGFVHSGAVLEADSGILNYLTTKRRGNYLVPPLRLRALPYPDAVGADLTVDKQRDVYRVEIRLSASDVEDGYSHSPSRLDTETVQFGWYYDVNRARGAGPSEVYREAGDYVFEFPASETGLGVNDRRRARLFGKLEDTRKPVFATAELPENP